MLKPNLTAPLICLTGVTIRLGIAYVNQIADQLDSAPDARIGIMQFGAILLFSALLNLQVPRQFQWLSYITSAGLLMVALGLATTALERQLGFSPAFQLQATEMVVPLAAMVAVHLVLARRRG